jgi:hypothetical protein
MPIDAAHRDCLLLAAALCTVIAAIVWVVGGRMRMLTRRGLLAGLGIVVTVGAIVAVPAVLLIWLFGKGAGVVVGWIVTLLFVWRTRSAIRHDPSRSYALDLGLQLGALGALLSGITALQKLRSLSGLPESQRKLAAAIAAGKRHAALQRSVDLLLQESLAPAWTHLLVVVSACVGIALVLAIVLAVRTHLARSLAPVIGVLFVFDLARYGVAHRPTLRLLVEGAVGVLAAAYVRRALKKDPDAANGQPVPGPA